MRGFLFRIPVGSSLLLTGAGIFLVVIGLLAPSFIFYWNRPPIGSSGGTGMSGSIWPGQEMIMDVPGSESLVYNVKVETNGTAHVDMISWVKGISSQDWGMGTRFSKSLAFTSNGMVQIRISNPSSGDFIAFEATALPVAETGYPSQNLPASLPYLIPIVTIGAILLGMGGVLLKRDTAAILSLRKEKGFWTCFLMPMLIVLDAVITYASIHSYGPAVESNPMITSLYMTGLWAVLIFHITAIVLVAGLSFFTYGMMVRSGLPMASKLAIAILFSTIFGFMSSLVVFTSIGLLSWLVPTGFERMWFLFMMCPLILLSTIVATYLTTIIIQRERQQ